MQLLVVEPPLKNRLVNIIQFLGLKIKMFETGNQPDYLHDIRITSPLSHPIIPPILLMKCQFLMVKICWRVFYLTDTVPSSNQNTACWKIHHLVQ